MALIKVFLFMVLYIYADCEREKEKNPADCCSGGQKKALFILIEPVSCKPPSELWQSYSTKMDELLCQAFYTSCCKKTAEVQFCEFGKRMAIANQLCLKNSKIGGVMQKQCCECCKRGKRIAATRRKCDTTEEGFCAESFRSCCEEALEKLPLTTPTSQKTCANTCDPKSTRACENTKDGPRCKCKEGYAPMNDGITCKDIDECKSAETNRCPNSCVNKEGSYTCECEGDLFLKDGACVEKVGCKEGYKQENGRCVDIDECATNTHRCSKSSYCVNEPGDYRCQQSCKSPDFRINPSNGNCEDVDECVKGTHNCNNYHKCVNVIGGYDCKRISCQEGFKFVDGYCEDMDECKQNEDICGDKGTCINKDGTYTCACQTGYDVKNGKCEDINECKLNRAYCQHHCINTLGSYRCGCPKGYDVIKNYCNDIDECKSNETCVGEFCANGFGHYYCIDDSCPQPYFERTKVHDNSPLSCVKKECKGNKQCERDPLQSLKRVYYRFTNVVEKKGFKFTYTLGFNLKHYAFKIELLQGSGEKFFKRHYLSKSQVQIENSKKITGPKTFHLIMKTDISTVKGGNRKVPTWQYEYHFHIHVSKYNF